MISFSVSLSNHWRNPLVREARNAMARREWNTKGGNKRTRKREELSELRGAVGGGSEAEGGGWGGGGRREREREREQGV